MRKVLFGTVCAAAAAFATDYTWLSNPADGFWHGANWSPGAWVDSADNAAIFNKGASDQTIDVGDGVTAAGVNVTGGAYTFTGTGPFAVKSFLRAGNGATVTVDTPVTQPSGATQLLMDRAGTLVFKKGADLKQFTQTTGTVVLDGCTVRASGNDNNVNGGGGRLQGGNLEIKNGAALKLGATSYSYMAGGTLTLTNGTLDARDVGEFLNAHKDNNSAMTKNVITIADKGVLKARKFRIGKVRGDEWFEKNVVNVLPGGVLDIGAFSVDNEASAAGYATINFDGGWLAIVTNIFSAANNVAPLGGRPTEGAIAGCGGLNYATGNGGSYANTHYCIGPRGLMLSNRVSSIRFRQPLRGSLTGEMDGGLHVMDSSVFYLEAANSFRGGLHLYNSGAYAVTTVTRDEAAGAVPDTPTTNIFFHKKGTAPANSGLLFAEQYSNITLHSNRLVHIDADATARFSANAGVRFTIKGTIDGERKQPDEFCPTSIVTLVDGKWRGCVAFDPGADKTNFFGRLYVAGHGEIKSGQNFVEQTVPTTGTDEKNVALWVDGSGLSDFSDTRGRLRVSGGDVWHSQKANGYLRTENWGQLDICGGRVHWKNSEVLNALNSPGRIIVRDGGELECGRLRVSQISTAANAQIHCKTGGVLRISRFYIDVNATGRGQVFFDGGTVVLKDPAIEQSSGRSSPLGTTNGKWTNITFYVQSGGLKIDTPYEAALLRPLYSGVEGGLDGGVVKTGEKALLFKTNMFYTGATVAKEGRLCFRVPTGTLPPGNTVVAWPGARVDFLKNEGNDGDSEQTLARIEGSGIFECVSKLTVTGAVAPGVTAAAGGTAGMEIGELQLTSACALAGDLEIDVGADGASDCLYVAGVARKQDVSGLSVKVMNPEALDKETKYRIFRSGSAGYTGTFNEEKLTGAARGWKVQQTKTEAFLYYPHGTTLILR